jgi:membrane protein DedA with SNARE-associated domain
VYSLIEHGGYLGIVLFLVLTGCGLPIPEEVPIVLAGVLSSQGHFDPWLAFAACVVGALLGDSAMYWIGYHFGPGLVNRHPLLSRWLGATRHETFDEAVTRHMFKVMALARFMVGVRGPVYLSAGIVRAPFRRFILSDLVCATVVVGTFFWSAYLFGDQIAKLVKDAEWALTLVVALAILIGALGWFRKNKQPIIDETVVRVAQDEDVFETGESSNRS